MYIKIKNKKQEHKVLEKLGNDGHRWATNVYPLDFKPSLCVGFEEELYPYYLEVLTNISWTYDERKVKKPIKAKDFLNPEHIKTDNSKVNENLLKENEELKDKLDRIEIENVELTSHLRNIELFIKRNRDCSDYLWFGKEGAFKVNKNDEVLIGELFTQLYSKFFIE